MMYSIWVGTPFLLSSSVIQVFGAVMSTEGVVEVVVVPSLPQSVEEVSVAVDPLSVVVVPLFVVVDPLFVVDEEPPDEELVVSVVVVVVVVSLGQTELSYLIVPNASIVKSSYP